MKQTVRHGLGIALSAMAFLCNYSPWVREAASLPDALTLTSGQKFVVQTGLPMLAASDGGAVSVLASQDERVTISAEAGGQTSVTFSLLGLIPVHETRVNVVEERTLIPGGQAVGVALKTRGVLVVSDAAKGRALRAGDVILSADGKNVESTKALSEQIGTAQTDTVRLEVLRGGQTITVDAQAKPDPSDGRRKLGVWVRDSTAGVGTLTYIDPANQAYGALGHAIVDADTAYDLLRRIPDMDVSMADNWNKRYRENMQRIKSGDLTELAAVIKALTQRDEKRPLSTGERRMLNQARQILLSEISLSVNCPYDFAEAQLDQCLRKPNKRSVLNR